MTGFASATGAEGPWSFQMDIRSVNGRGLDARVRAPDWIDGLDVGLRRVVQAAVGRGSVTLSVRVARDEAQAATSVNADGLSAVLRALSEIQGAASEAGVTLSAPSAAEIAAIRGVMDTGDDDRPDITPLAKAIVSEAETLVKAFNKDRAREGAALAAILTAQIDEVERLTAAAAAALGDRAEAQRAALERNLARLLDASELPDAARLQQELALIAVKSDVTEEIDRLGAHVAAARELLATSGPVGRKLDFLMQEFNREANTLCSKAGSSALTAIGLDLKTVIDQMREQVQNIE
ncbi:YicC family protein [Alphaproteobacteria bacterium GH1-50]|uniref:YicC family protein n=2 Tax=Kangsaoukella pontilimi TaxID=2691042 RepID=A0A7C9M9B8_9RHOB|nr:YicC family protein [Kangsaoukella pontilimi]